MTSRSRWLTPIHERPRWTGARRIAGAVVAATLIVAPARAQAVQATPTNPKVEWSPDWPRFRLWEYAATAVIGATSLYLYRYRLPPTQEKWQGSNAFDSTVRGWLRAETPEGRARAGHVSDVLWWGGSAMPFVIDLPVALFVHRQPQVAWQMLMMDLEAQALAGLINNTSYYLVGRGRPSHPDCDANPGYDSLCGSRSNNASFPSGHTLGIATATGVTCAHHQHLPLYGTPAADASACVVMSLATVATGITRIMADRHNASDVIVGAAIGFASGYGLPTLLHYRSSGPGGAVETRPPRPVVIPFGGPREVGVGIVGVM